MGSRPRGIVRLHKILHTLLLERGLIVADHQKLKGLNASDYVKITASGYYHLRFLSTRWEYLSNIAFDTPLLGFDAAKGMSRYQEDSRDHAAARIDLLTQNLNQQVEAIGISIPGFETRSNAYSTLKNNVNKAISFSLGNDSSDEISEQGSLDL
jgi:hypothetical protein